MVIFLLFLSLCSTAIAEDPWSKDASLIPISSSRSKEPPSCPFQQAILFHQTILSPADGPRSHFYPSSSEYGKKAIAQWGMITGLQLTFERLMRENNERWLYPVTELPSKVKLKYDPIP
jgi:hypothetical protein